MLVPDSSNALMEMMRASGATPKYLPSERLRLLAMTLVTCVPWVVDRELAVRDVVELSLTFDHRVCDGGEAAGFLRRLADLVERPTLLLAS